ncbi:DNA/RNA polymerase [Rhizoclosmatium globosum]|uniref:DNA/RNA polymerase n=1 Tax=Rhizoclosmatium globosum TaxID=329046 RepID=A0A1Y2CHR4_9FUNG|nr:DNA/RNA polymerase [Rhizoclosmatium globosum]|eukprot:ORY46542.1 DNA/RNA polymerase [Rhizoclosmatium globosum]
MTHQMSEVDARHLKARVVIHVDLDSFYAQVEQVRLGLPRDQPLAVQQWQLLTAVNYAARAFGIKKMSSVEEAKAACPDITLVHTASIANGDTEAKYHTNPNYYTHKISLDIMDILSRCVIVSLGDDSAKQFWDPRFSPKFQRASVDEAYLDMTDLVNERIIEMGRNGSIEFKDGLPVVKWEDSGAIVVGVTGSSDTEEPTTTTLGWEDYNSARIRTAVDTELHYTCSAGISHNKTLAKLCSALNKPNKQTVLLQDQVLAFLKPLPFQKIRNLGGKLGTEIEEVWSVETCGQVWDIPLSALQLKLGEASGSWVHDIVRGVCTEPVMQTQLQKSIGANKAFRNPPLKSMDEVVKWVDVLACEIFLRWPKSFSVSYRMEGKQTTAKSAPMPSRVRTVCPDTLSKLANSLLGSAPIVPCRHISLGCNGFIKEDVNINSVAKFFKKATDNESPSLDQLRKESSVDIQTSPTKTSSALLQQIDVAEQEDLLKQFEVDNQEAHCIRCERCGKYVSADDFSLAEHEDYHVAIELHREITTEVLGSLTGKGAGMKPAERKSAIPAKVKTEHSVGTEITNFFKRK